MATPHPHTGPVGPDTLITVKVIIDGTNRRFKLALRDLGASTLPQKLRLLLAIPHDQEVRFDRFSDSAGTYITLDSNNPAIYKQLYRAAKAKLKLRLKATIIKPGKAEKAEQKAFDAVNTTLQTLLNSIPAAGSAEPRQSFLETVLSQPVVNGAAPPFKSFQQTCSYSPRCAIPGAFDATAHADTSVKEAQAEACDPLSLPTLPSLNDFPMTTYSIDCNHCGQSVPDEHFHCSICEKGDFDLCKKCVQNGVYCDGDEHWLIKRTIKNGVVVPSVTETHPPRKLAKVDIAASEEPVTPVSPQRDEEDERTCNCCINQLPSRDFVTCNDCPDFDLCLVCFQDGEHGHDPSHSFHETIENSANDEIKLLCIPGRGARHEAFCDGCDKAIVGVRHKCFSCPDFDYCSECILSADITHEGHRFAPLYTPLPFKATHKEIHRGIYCDGPLCTSYKRYISGVRYKCAICHDTDFCANCEALANNGHNATHPLIKIKTAIRHVQITTQQETDGGHKIEQLGDKPLAKHAATETIRSTSTNAATQVLTVAEVKPAENAPFLKVEEKTPAKLNANDLQAWYVSDSTPDGTKIAPNHLVSQSWTLRNPGPEAWPAGCAVYYIGGDDMRNLDNLHPSSVSNMVTANRSNILAESLEPGKTAVFTVLLKSPVREGRSISYWRLKTPGGLPFGHKLWVDIEVQCTPVELPIRSALLPAPPATMETEVESKEEELSASSSTMIFPKLEKESPVSSIHNVSESHVEEAPAAVVEPTIKTVEQELLEDVESLELEESESEDEAFLTDEEYDILDADDEDFLAANN